MTKEKAQRRFAMLKIPRKPKILIRDNLSKFTACIESCKICPAKMADNLGHDA